MNTHDIELPPLPFVGGLSTPDYEKAMHEWCYAAIEANRKSQYCTVYEEGWKDALEWAKRNRKRKGEPVGVPIDEIVEAVEAYGRAYSMPNTTASELSIRLHEIRALLSRYGQCLEQSVAWRWSESNGEHWFGWTTDWSYHDRAVEMGCQIEYAAPIILKQVG